MGARLFGCLLTAAITASTASAQTPPTSPADPVRLAAAHRLFNLLQAGDRAQKIIDQVFGAAADAVLKQELSRTNSDDPNFGERQRRLALVRKNETSALLS